jgi:predicted DNA-binding transcriptional regulator YafY
MATPNTRRLVSLATAADMLDVSTKTIRRYIA